MNISKLFWPVFIICAVCSVFLISAGRTGFSDNFRNSRLDSLYDKLTEEQKRSPKYALAGLTVAEGLQAELFASEPMLTNPTNLTIDHKGRVWVCEAYNYRPEITGNKAREKGDRILILEDTNQDGKADKSTVFYQGPELNAPIGIWVAGNQVIVSQSPYVWLFTDDNGDNKADRKEIIFQGIEGTQHDHGVHAFVVGPDGKYYFNFGNEGKKILDAKGNPIRGKDGQPIDFSKYKEGLVFRCNPDFTEFEVIGQNFRNNFEVAVDSYGTLWQSDNDDDGNRAVRINYVMEYGNFGFTNELTGAGWRTYRTNWEDSIPERHWHLNDPGVVPNLLQTGAGSPTGMLIYEGNLLPEVFHNQMIHSDPGPNVVRSYPVKKQGAGYDARIEPILKGERDQWFRPSDVAVAPDGSLFISDWYDPGVGGHQMGDQHRGRIFRITPKGYKGYKNPTLDFKSAQGAILGLQNPNPEARILAMQSLIKMGDTASKALLEKWASPETDSRLRARVLWILGKNFDQDGRILTKAAQDNDPDIRITAIRIGRQGKFAGMNQMLLKLSLDPDIQVRREVAIALRDSNIPDQAKVWVNLAKQHTGNDRWYLEALGIGAHDHWGAFFKAWLDLTEFPLSTPGNKDIVWRARTALAAPLQVTLAGDPTEPLKSRLRYFRALDFNPGTQEKSKALMQLLNKQQSDPEINKLVLRHLDPGFVKSNPTTLNALEKQLEEAKGTMEYINLVQDYQLNSENTNLLDLVLTESGSNMGRAAASLLFRQEGEYMIRSLLSGNDEQKILKIIPAIRSVGNTASVAMLNNLVLDESRSNEVRKAALLAQAGSQAGEDMVLLNLKEGRVTGDLKKASVEGLKHAWRKAVRMEAEQYLEQGVVASEKTKHPPVAQLIERKGDVVAGEKVFMLYCATCHQVGNKGMDFGPKLTEIGDKLPRQGQYLSIFSPSSGISFGYEGYEVTMKDGSVAAGIMVSKTPTSLVLKFPGGNSQTYQMSDVKSVVQMTESMMTAGLAEAMSTTELVDLVEYLISLKK